MLWTGWFFAAITGMILPSFFWMIGDVFDSFNPSKEPSQTLEEILTIFYIIVGLCITITITATVYFSCLAKASSMIAARIKQHYLAAILRQESGWFDMINYTELSLRLSKECLAI